MIVTSVNFAGVSHSHMVKPHPPREPSKDRVRRYHRVKSVSGNSAVTYNHNHSSTGGDTVHTTKDRVSSAGSITGESFTVAENTCLLSDYIHTTCLSRWNIWNYIFSLICLGSQRAVFWLPDQPPVLHGKHSNDGHFTHTWQPNSGMPAVLMGTIGHCHFRPLPVTENLPECQKVSAKQNLSGDEPVKVEHPDTGLI